MRLTKRAVVTSYVGSISGYLNVIVAEEHKRMIIKIHENAPCPNVGEEVVLFYDKSDYTWKIAA